MLRAAVSKEGIPIATATPVTPFRGHFKFPPFRNILGRIQVSVSHHVISVHGMRVRKKLFLGEVEVAIDKTVHAQAAPYGVAKGDGPAVGAAGRIIDGVFQKVVHRDGTFLNQVGG